MKHKTVITISRQYGSGGREIGRKLAEELGIPFYDKELISLTAKKSGLGEDWLREVDEKASSSLLYSLSMTGSMGSGFDLPLNDKVFLLQSDIIREVAKEGSCVIVGRCADYVLKEEARCINLFIHADLSKRVERAVQVYNQPAAKAESIVLKTDKRRATYYNYYTGIKWGGVENYDLSLDSGRVGPEGAVKVIKAFIEAADAAAE